MTKKDAFVRAFIVSLVSGGMAFGGPVYAKDLKDSNKKLTSFDTSSKENKTSGRFDNETSDKGKLGGRSSLSKQELRARLADTSGAVTAQVQFETKKTSTAFEGSVRVSIPNTYGIATQADAQNAGVTLTLGRGGQAYAQCALDLKSFKQLASSGWAKFAVEVSSLGTNLRENAGVCDIDLVTAGVQSGVPAVQAADDVSVGLADGTVIVAGKIN